MNKIVLIGDIVSSKKIADRAIVQKNLADVLTRLNKREQKPESPYTITLGDEFQAVFTNADTLFFDAISILLAVYPEKIRFSLGIGTINTPINHQAAIGMDGPAFYHARDGIEAMKRTPYLFDINGLNDPCSVLVEESLNLISHLSRNWKKRRLEILLRLNDHLSVKEISEQLQISDKAVYKAIDMGALKVIIRIFEEITRTVNNSLEER